MSVISFSSASPGVSEQEVAERYYCTDELLSTKIILRLYWHAINTIVMSWDQVVARKEARSEHQMQSLGPSDGQTDQEHDHTCPFPIPTK